MKRLFDVVLSLLVSSVLLFPIVVVAVLVRITPAGPALYWSDRVGRLNKIFRMPKFRSMRVGTPAVATHLLADATSHLTPMGSFLRKSSLDELLQSMHATYVRATELGYHANHACLLQV